MQNDIDPTEIEPAHPAVEGLYPVIDEVKDAAIEEIRNASKKSTKLSYKMVIVGALFGFLGSFLVSTLLRGYDADWSGLDNLILIVLGIIAFFGSAILIAWRIKNLK